MRSLIFIAAAAMLLVAAPACMAEPIGDSDTVVRPIAEPMTENVLMGMKDGDYDKYIRDCDDTLRETMTVDVFSKASAQLKANLGDYVSKEYLGFLTKGKMTLVLWKAKFTEAGEDVLIKIVISRRADKNYITGIWFE